jgi:GT2 family glycosyltransferase
MISVIIPVLNYAIYTKQLLINIRNNIKKPKEIFIIDDKSVEDIKGLTLEFTDLNIIYIRHNRTLGFNYACNEGMQLSTGDYISFLNNDIIINNYFFKKIEEAFLNDQQIGIICPMTIKEKDKIIESSDEKIILTNMKKREGWAYSANMSFIKRIHLIPSFLRTYCGDDYIFYKAQKLNYKCMKIMNNYIYHYGGLTVGITPKCSGEREREKVLYNKFISGEIDENFIA